MNKAIKEISVFILFAYLGAWMSFFIIYIIDLRSSNPTLNYIESIYLIQFSFIIWIISIFLLYLLRIVLFLIMNQLNGSGGEKNP
jgi:hypothetical protein